MKKFYELVKTNELMDTSNENLPPIERLPYEIGRKIIELIEPIESKQLSTIDHLNKKWNFWVNTYRNEKQFWQKHLEKLIGERLAEELFKTYSSFKKAFLYVEHLTDKSLNKIFLPEIMTLLRVLKLEMDYKRDQLMIAEPTDFIKDNQVNYNSSIINHYIPFASYETINTQASAVRNLLQNLKTLGMTEDEIFDFAPCFIAKHAKKFANSFSLIHMYADFGFCEGIKYLIFNKEDINKRVKFQNCTYGHPSDENDDEGMTPLETAFMSCLLEYKQDVKVFNIFLEANCNVDINTILIFFKNHRNFVDYNMKLYYSVYEKLIEKLESINQDDLDKIISAIMHAIENEFSNLLERKPEYLNKFLNLTYQKYHATDKVNIINENEKLKNKIQELELTIAISRGYKQQLNQEMAPDDNENDDESDSKYQGFGKRRRVE